MCSIQSYTYVQLIYILMGPKAANRVYDAMPRGGAIEFGRFPWWRSPDSVLLVFLGLVRKGKTSPGEPLKVPVDLQCVGWVYANAHAEDLATLDKVSVFDLVVSVSMILTLDT